MNRPIRINQNKLYPWEKKNRNWPFYEVHLLYGLGSVSEKEMSVSPDAQPVSHHQSLNV